MQKNTIQQLGETNLQISTLANQISELTQKFTKVSTQLLVENNQAKVEIGETNGRIQKLFDQSGV